MPSTQNIAIAAAAGIVVLGGAAWFAQDNLKLWSGGIHSVDFRNAQVEVVGTACADPQLTTAGVTKLPLHDGFYQLGQYQFEVVGDVRYGDVSGHTGETGSDKAVFVGSCSNAGKTSQVLFVYGMEDGKPERVASTDLSGSENTLVQSYTVGDGSIQIKANQGDPPALVTLTYALLNGSLVNLNPAATAPQTAQPATAPASAPAAEIADNSADNSDVGEDRINFQTFHDELSPYGRWMNHPVWGLVWHPTAVPANFQPYREGHWENTDEYGTAWVSDYSWGDVPFHYGRWGYDPSNGWLWQPGYTWSPAWVAWRAGSGDIGWFPIPPGYYDGSAAFTDDWDGWYGYRALYPSMDPAAFYGLWSFVPADDIYAPSIAVDVIAAGAYAGFIGRTVGWTRFGVARGRIANFAIDGARFRGAFGHPLPASSRHDFQAHHGPMVGVAKGRLIASHERVSVGVGHGVGMHATLGNHHGTAVHHTPSYAHSYAHGTYSHSFGSTHTEAHTGFAQHSGFGGGESHSSFGGTQRSFGGTGAAEHRSFGGEQRSSFGGGASAHSSFGGGSTQHSFGGGAYAQRPASGGASYAQRPAMGGQQSGGGIARAPQVQAPRPAPAASTQRHH